MQKIFKNIGTRSVLYGAHCFFIHPWFVALAWIRLYGFPFDPRLWLAFFVHDLGYIGKPNMDGPEGELHPYRGALIMGALFGKFWFDFTLYHSRFLAKKNNAQYSKLCVADKLAFALTPKWLYLPMVNWTGEIHEYMGLAGSGKYSGENNETSTQEAWHQGVVDYMGKWIEEHKEIKPDKWTQAADMSQSNEIDRSPGHIHYFIYKSILCEAYRTSRGIRHRELLPVPDLLDHDKVSDDLLIAIEQTYLQQSI